VAVAILLSACTSSPDEEPETDAPALDACDPQASVLGPLVASHPSTVGAPEEVANRTAAALGLAITGFRLSTLTSLTWNTTNGIIGYDSRPNGSVVWAYFREPWLAPDSATALGQVSTFLQAVGFDAAGFRLQVEALDGVVTLRILQDTPAGALDAGNGWSGSPTPPVNGGWKGTLWLQPLFDPAHFEAQVLQADSAVGAALAFERCRTDQEAGEMVPPYSVVGGASAHASITEGRLAYAVDAQLLPSPGALPSVECLSRRIDVDAVTGAILARGEITGC
jgi:hypothetical protein